MKNLNVSIDDLRSNTPWITTEDPLAQAWYNYECAMNPGQYFNGISFEHRTSAQKTKEYYSDKLMIRMLAGNQLTPFQKDLYSWLCGNEPLMEKHRGMIYKLPYFYVEDHDRVDLAKKFKNSNVSAFARYSVIKERTCLYPVQRIFSSRKNNEIMEFWFKTYYDAPILWAVNIKNPLYDMVQSLWDYKKPIEIKAIFARKDRDFQYLLIHKPELILTH